MFRQQIPSTHRASEEGVKVTGSEQRRSFKCSQVVCFKRRGKGGGLHYDTVSEVTFCSLGLEFSAFLADESKNDVHSMRCGRH